MTPRHPSQQHPPSPSRARPEPPEPRRTKSLWAPCCPPAACCWGAMSTSASAPSEALQGREQGRRPPAPEDASRGWRYRCKGRSVLGGRGGGAVDGDGAPPFPPKAHTQTPKEKEDLGNTPSAGQPLTAPERRQGRHRRHRPLRHRPQAGCAWRAAPRPRPLLAGRVPSEPRAAAWTTQGPSCARCRRVRKRRPTPAAGRPSYRAGSAASARGRMTCVRLTNRVLFAVWWDAGRRHGELTAHRGPWRGEVPGWTVVPARCT